MHPRA